MMQRTDYWKRPWCWERLRARGEEGDRGWDGWMISRLNGLEFGQTLGDSEGQRSLACCSPWGCKSHTWLSDQTTTTTSTLYLREQLLEEVESHGWERVHSRDKRAFHKTLDTGSYWRGQGEWMVVTYSAFHCSRVMILFLRKHEIYKQETVW